jgi:hypothetical protein
MQTKIIRAASAVMLAALLIGCGGSGSSDSAAPAPVASGVPTPGASPAPTPGASPPGSTPIPTPTSSPLPPLPPVTGEQPGLIPPPAVSLTIPSTPPLTVTGPLAPTITAAANGRWGDAATWGGRVPADGDIVMIPRGKTVELAGATARLNGMWVDGALTFGDADLALTSKFIMVTGRLQAGTEVQPYARRAVITLTGTDTAQDVMSMGTKLIGVMNGGLLKLHGEQRLAWSQLAAHAEVGATNLTLKDSAATWRAGDQLVLVASGFDPREAEVVTVTGIGGSTVSFTPALKYRHLSVLQTFEGKTLDQRAAVGLLSRNIVIQGADDSDANAFGGHVMVMGGGHAQVSGVELRKMGQRGLAGRYPFHWHLAGDRAGNYLMSSAIHSSFQRATVMHSTHNVTLDGNVAYNIPNHAFVWAEDGDEYGNTLTRNLGVLIRNPAPEHFAFPINNAFHGNTSQGEHRSAVFWGRSFNKHVIRGNISAGALDGFGFFFDLFTPAPNGGDEGGGMVFAGNIAHSTYKTLATGNQINYPEATTGHGLMISTGTSGKYTHVFRDYTGYHNVTPAWVEDRSTQLRDSIVADNGNGVTVLRGVVDGVVVVGKSANPVALQASPASINFGVRAGVQVAGSNHGGKRSPVILNTAIINQDGAGVIYDVDNLSPSAALGQVKYINTPTPALIMSPLQFEFFPDRLSTGINDPAGAFLGDGKPARIFAADAPFADAQCASSGDLNAFACPAAGTLLLQSSAELALLEESGQTLYLRSFGYHDRSMPEEGAASHVADGKRYFVMAGTRSRHEFTLSDAQGKSVELAFAVGGAPARVVQAGQNVSASPSLAALRAAGASSYFHDVAAQRLYVRLAGGAVTQAVSIEAPFTNGTVANGYARAAVALPAGAVDGFAHAAHTNIAKVQLRFAAPTAAAARSGKVSAAIIDGASTNTVMQQSTAGDTTVLRGYVNAPVDGLYRLGLWGNGGGTSLWVGDTFVMGQSWAFMSSNWYQNGQLQTEFGVFNPNGVVALRAGWHPVTLIHAKMPENKEGNTLLLRWIAPGGDRWVYPQVRREP